MRKRVLITEKSSEREVRAWARKYGIELDRGAFNAGGKNCIGVKYVPKSVEWRDKAGANYTELVATVAGAEKIIGLVVYDNPMDKNPEEYCAAPVLT